MVDVHNKKQRSFNMSRIRSHNTKPEKKVRSLIHEMGFRFRLHRKDLPGKPDVVLPKHKKIIFVHGCFWHLHDCKYGKVQPKTNTDFWNNKRTENKLRDKKNIEELKKMGWKILIIWGCQTKDTGVLRSKLYDFLVQDL